MCLLDRWPTRRQEFAGLVDRIFYQWSLLPGLDADMRERYQRANRVALSFVRRLETTVRAGQLGGLRRALRRFWSADMHGKLELAGT